MSTSQITQVKVDDLTVDPKVQRQLDTRRVRKLADGWDRHMVGILTVSRRLNGDLVVLDGQTRWEAARLANVKELRAEVFEGLSEAKEAEIFLKHNDRKAVTPRDRFRLAVVACEEKALRIRDIAAAHGWYLQGMPNPGKARPFASITAAEKIYEADGGKALRRTFAVIDNAWGNQPGAVCSETLYGIGELFAAHPTGIDAAGLATKLGKMGLNAYLAACADRRRTHPGQSIRSASAGWTKELYNRGRRTHRL